MNGRKVVTAADARCPQMRSGERYSAGTSTSFDDVFIDFVERNRSNPMSSSFGTGASTGPDRNTCDGLRCPCTTPRECR